MDSCQEENRDALLKITSTVNDSHRKYALGVFHDIKGAFNELSWGVILRSLRRMEIDGGFNFQCD